MSQEQKALYSMYTGKLIAVEGIDGSGKSTLVKMLSQHLKSLGLDIVTTKEGGGTPLGKKLLELLHFNKEVISDTAEFLLFAADRAQHFSELVIPALQKGSIIISDRMADSSLAYQGFGRELTIEMIKKVNQWAMHNIRPHAVLYLHVDLVTAQARIESRNQERTSFEKEKELFWQRVMDGYEQIFKNRHDVIRIDGSKSPDDIFHDALEALLNRGIIKKDRL
jgi:dTMP kinase